VYLVGLAVVVEFLGGDYGGKQLLKRRFEGNAGLKASVDNASVPAPADEEPWSS